MRPALQGVAVLLGRPAGRSGQTAVIRPPFHAFSAAAALTAESSAPLPRTELRDAEPDGAAVQDGRRS